MIIPIFIMHRGCGHRCTFCNQHQSAGPYPEDISEAFFRRTVLTHLQSQKKPHPVQIAFYGGNFTGMAESDQARLLDYARPFLEAGRVSAIRISTRPDHIDRKGLDFLKQSGVRVVEVGAQSLDDEVLRRTGRGHTARDVETAVELLRAGGFEVGMHLMAGLPGDSPEGFCKTVAGAAALQPHMVRLHPTLVFADTPLADACRSGLYRPLTIGQAVRLCEFALLHFTAAGIPVIRLGLQTTPDMRKSGTVIAGPYHAAFRCLVESSIWYDRAASLLKAGDSRGQTVLFFVHPREQGAFRGLRNENIGTLRSRFGLADIRVVPDPAQPAGILHMRCGKIALSS